MHIDARFNGQLGIFWSDTNYVLEAIDVLGSPSSWQPITNGIETVESTMVYSVTNAAEISTRFFRLRK